VVVTDIENRVTARISESDERITDLTCRLIAVQTENPPGRCYGECVALLESELTALGLPYELIRLPDDEDSQRYAVVSGFGSGPTVYLHGHYDVVPASRPDQFQPVVRGGRIVGRGASDMKGGIAAIVYAVKALQPERLPGRVELVLVPDEETGGRRGSEYLARSARLGRNGIGALIGEPTSGAVWNGSRGAITLRVRLAGKPAHVGLQHEGRNAFEAALPLLLELQGLKAQVEQRCTAFAVEPEAARHSILMLGGEVVGGHQFNVVPEHFSFTVERRINPEEDIAAEKAVLLETIDRAKPESVDAQVQVIQEGAQSATDAGSALGRILAAAVGDVTGTEPAFELCPGLLETRFYAERGVPALAYGPGVLSVSHGPEEYVAVSRLVDCAKIYGLTALRLLLETSETS
jgi:acetylornithine deacetylase/succinyl-diaminopimelate desuccinylase family protein